MKGEQDFIEAVNVIRGQKVENQVEIQIIGGNENYKNISNQNEKDAFLEGVLKTCGNYKWSFNKKKLSELSNSEQKIIIPHLKDFTCPTSRTGMSRRNKQFSTVNDVTNFILEGQTVEEKEESYSCFCNVFVEALSNLISAFCFLFVKKAVSGVDDARAKILGVNTCPGMFNGLGVTNWLNDICKTGGCNLGNIPDFAVAEFVYAACNDDSYDFSYDINFSGQKSANEKDKDLKIENLLNFLVDQEKQETITDFNSEQKEICQPAPNQMLRRLKIKMGAIIFLSVGLVSLSLWLVSLVSVTLCFIELGLFVFIQIISFIAKHLSEDNRVGKIIMHKYAQCFLFFMQFPITLVALVFLLCLGF